MARTKADIFKAKKVESHPADEKKVLGNPHNKYKTAVDLLGRMGINPNSVRVDWDALQTTEQPGTSKAKIIKMNTQNLEALTQHAQADTVKKKLISEKNDYALAS